MDLTRTAAMNLVKKGANAFDKLDIGIRKRVQSIVVFNSVIREDFVTNMSDIDILLVFNAKPIDKIVNRVQKCFIDIAIPYRGKSNCFDVFDIPWVSSSELPYTNNKTSVMHTQWKFLGIYAFDFVAHSRVLRGEDFRRNIIVRDPKRLIHSRLDDLMNKSLKQTPDEPWRVVMITGELIRLAQIKYGERTLDKRLVYRNFKKLVPYFEGKDFVDTFWDMYLTGRVSKMSDSERLDYFGKCERFNEQLFKLLR